MLDIDAVKAANRIETVVAEDEALEEGRGGRYVRGKDHDSLVVDTRKQAYYWNSHNEFGDVIEWVIKRRRVDFKAAVELLCRRAGLPDPRWGEGGQAAVAARARADCFTVACREWVLTLRKSPGAMQYLLDRGFTEEGIQDAGLGYTGRPDGGVGVKKALEREGIDLQGDVARAVVMAPPGCVVYPHVFSGRVVYFACRSASTEEKRHWNPPASLVGERQAYWNAAWHAAADTVVVVEGQADAVSLAEWGIAAVAVAGMSLAETESTRQMLRLLSGHQIVGVGLDQGADPRGLCDALGPLTRVVEWPWKDPNDGLQAGADVDEVRTLIREALTWVEVVAGEVGADKGAGREAGLKRVFELLARLDDFQVAMYRDQVARLLGIGIRGFKNLLKAAKGEAAAEDGEGEDGPSVVVEIPGGYVGGYLLEMVVIAPVNETPPNPPVNGGGHGGGGGQGDGGQYRGEKGSGKGQWRTRFACRNDGSRGIFA